MERAAVVVRLVNAAVVDSIRICSDERVVAIVDHGDGEAGGEAGDAGDRPAAGEPVGVQEAIDRKLVLVAEDEVLFHVER